MVRATTLSLLYAEDLTLPSVVVITANMGCARCRERVSRIVSKMTGLNEFIVDATNKRVTMKADFGPQNNNGEGDSRRRIMKLPGCYGYAVLQFFITVSEQFASAMFWKIKQKSAS